jgi:N-acetylneuraminic acid mutarotase
MNIQKIVFFIFPALLLLSCNDPAESPYAQITFEKRTTLPGTGRASAVTFVIDGKGYVALGRTAVRSGALNDCWQYDPDSDNWTQKSIFPGIPRVKALAAVVAGKAYVGLGYNIDKGVYSGGNLSDFWMYDPVTNTWLQKKSYPSSATDACVSFVLNNNIYVGEGFNESDFTNEFWKYNTLEDSWTRLKDFPGDSRMGAVLCEGTDHIYFGMGYHTGNYNDWWEYFPLTDNWKQLKALPDNGRVNAISLTINNRYFVSTGRCFAGDLTGGKVYPDILEYDVVRNVWYKRGNIPSGGRENAIAFTINGKGYIGQGENDTMILNDFWCFTP